MQIARASQPKSQPLPTRAYVERGLESAQDRVDVNSYQERLTNFGIGWGGLVGAGVGAFGGCEILSQGLIRTGDPVGDVMLGASFVGLTMVGGILAGSLTMGTQGYVLGSMADRISRALGE
jgi:hypothetical protein